jgi:ATP-dependent Lhr-like helicase
MEEAGRIRRGYFVAGMGGSQFALPGAVDRLRGVREGQPRVVALAATDPANPFGVVLPWPDQQAARMARAAGAYVVLEGGELRLYLERGGRSLLTQGEVTPSHLEVLVAAVRGKIELQRVDGLDSRDSRLAPLLRQAGFGSSHRGLVHYPKTGT